MLTMQEIATATTSTASYAAVSAISVIVGGVLIKIVEKLLPSRDKKIDEETAFRESLRREVKELKAEVRLIDMELDQWKQKYFEILEKYTDIHQKYISLMRDHQDLMRDVEVLRERLRKYEDGSSQKIVEVSQPQPAVSVYNVVNGGDTSGG